MTSPSNPALQKLRDLDKSLSGFHDQLSNVLYGEEYARCVANLQGDDLKWLVDFLDGAFSGLPHFSAASRKCLRELRSICGAGAILPTSYTLSSNLDIDPLAFNAGGFGDVHKGTLDGSLVCVKRVRQYSQQDQAMFTKAFCREAVMWRHLKHPHIVPLLGTTTEPLQLISVWMPGGELLSYLKDSNANRLVLLSEVAEGLCYLHSRNVIHGDLKGPNILVDHVGHARITDFGIARITQSLDSIRSASTHDNAFTPRWTAPEVLRDGKHSKEADIFSFAMVMVEVFTGAVPFLGKPATAAIFDIMSGERPRRPTHPNCTTELWKLMNHCWDPNPYLRPAVMEVLSDLRGADRPTWRWLINDTLPADDRISLVTMIFSDRDQVKMVTNLSGDDAQIFVDNISEVLDGLAPQIHRRCLRYLYGICGDQALLPRSLEIPPCYNSAENPSFHSGSTDVWKGQHEGQEVSAQVLRVLPGDDTEKIKGRFCRVVVTWRALNHPNLLPLLGVTMTENQLVMVSEWKPNGNIMEFARANPNVDRLGLLRGITRGLIYMHDQRIIHGDLKGVNILIDDDGNARLAGFNLVTVASRRSAMAAPPDADGWIPWMSPELLYPEKFGLTETRPTVKSDIYALGMVVYEVLSGQVPFAAYRDPEVVSKVLEGKRPERPREDAGKPFTDDIWEVLEHCWEQQPRDRPSVQCVLDVLDGGLSTSWPPSDMDEEVETDTDDENTVVNKEKSEPSTESRSCVERPEQSTTNIESVELGAESSSGVEGEPRPLIMGGSDGIGTDPPQKRFPAVTRVRNNLRKLFPRDKSGGLSRPGSQ
ncbi:kinase-like domain-containing protein [Thelephora terrestris]|uniref:Kinase-like domain-containing protein n=1 Tax=Thelephora terrestris TaxID=56493 RepID=A0A9P6HKK6_9AGAM|nr:kinase-like domain-containing protein [Thelephora terrestris]